MSGYARIYMPAKTAMSSGKANTGYWVLEYVSDSAAHKDRLTGWNGDDDTQTQVRLKFASLEEAQAYVAAQDIVARIDAPRQQKPIAKSYSDNFRRNRFEPWSH